MGHVEAFLPFISDTGILIPERSIFSFLISCASFAHMLNIFLRFKQVEAELKLRDENKSQYRYIFPFHKIQATVGYLQWVKARIRLTIFSLCVHHGHARHLELQIKLTNKQTNKICQGCTHRGNWYNSSHT